MAINASALPARAFVETEESAPGFWQIGILWRVLATGIKTGGSLCILDEVVGGEPGGPVTHTHPMEECFYLLDGGCTVFAGGDTFHCGPGSFLAVPRYTRHAFMADAGSRLLNFYLPAGFEMLLMGLGAPAERNEPPQPADQVKMAPRRLVEKLAGDYGQISVLGTPFADPPDLSRMKTEPLADALATPFQSTVQTAPAYWSQGILWSVLAEGKTTDEQLCPLRGALSGWVGRPPRTYTSTRTRCFTCSTGRPSSWRATSARRSARAAWSSSLVARSTRSGSAARPPACSTSTPGWGSSGTPALGGQRTDQRTVPPADWRAPEVSKSRQSELFAELGRLS